MICDKNRDKHAIFVAGSEEYKGYLNYYWQERGQTRQISKKIEVQKYPYQNKKFCKL